MLQYTLKQIEADTGLKYDYLRKCLRILGEAFRDHAKKPPGKGWQFDEQGIELFRQVAGLKEAGLDLPQIKNELAKLGYLGMPEVSEASGVGDSAGSRAGSTPAGGPSYTPAPKTGEALFMELLGKVDKVNEKMEVFREKQFAKDRRMLKYQKRRERLLAQMEHLGFWSLLFKRKGIVAKIREVDEREGKRLRPIHIHGKEGLDQVLNDPENWAEE